MTSAKQLRPGDTIGILGGGQLGRMLAISAAELGLKCHIFCPDENSPAFEVADKATIADYTDLHALDSFAADCFAITYEFENVPGETAERLAATSVVRPSAKALEIAQDRLSEKDFLSGSGIALASYQRIDNQNDLENALIKNGGRGVLKTRRFGYDGKGQVMIRSMTDAKTALEQLGHAPAVLEELVSFDREVSVIVARDVTGSSATYELTENVHENHVLKTSTVPANVDQKVDVAAQAIAVKIADALDYIGVMGVEMFLVKTVGGDRLLVNEIAPRVHNSGHWTQDACLTSQFEQHIRAVAGWPLGSTKRHSNVIMHNLIGDDVTGYGNVLQEPNARLHLYGKAEARPGRKMGHVNRLSPRA
ncbi:5-(carboxyamino)imidazole ribonucleotide synthase [Roseibium hamelinense]|uniref:N5-carboxyaminoimidazole ribonucleotide synthase n=1 Tax=Roseibium hamelinense TaxID=150831 RepID=A0A562SLS4_9HYPH|nr:5-(carboxyamino)imidazole ribonucleotide synthase [Roseibium hamelinense]MTI45027.1 5-(carboxyamino)imidazole ribonucleotide synthase [Roseibium hamelinense]TWI82291.1 5-(carboxyamino)imidazole ribonucleotide synthase [Roseibium hamelinense]